MRGELTFAYGTLWAFLLVLARVAAALSIVPLPGIQRGPAPARLVFSVVLTIALFPVWPSAPDRPGSGWFLATVASEAAFGVTAGLAVALLLETIAVGFQVFGLQAGFSYASTIDPSTEADSSVLLVVTQLLGGLLFFALGLDRHLLRVFAHSLTAHPPGSFAAGESAFTTITALGSAMLSTGLRLAMPVIALLLLVDVSLALLGRLQQQLQLLSLAFPLKIAAALAILAAVLPLAIPLYRAAAERTFAALGQLL